MIVIQWMNTGQTRAELWDAVGKGRSCIWPFIEDRRVVAACNCTCMPAPVALLLNDLTQRLAQCVRTRTVHLGSNHFLDCVNYWDPNIP